MKEFKKVHVLVAGTLLLYLNNTFAFSNNFRPKGFYGSLEYTFLEEDSSLTKIDSTSHIQKYEIGYENFYYSPKLLKYDLSTALYINNTTTDREGMGSYSRDITNLNYRAYLDFIQGSKYPFTIFAEKNDIPFVSLLSLNSTYSNQSIDKYGIHGSLDLLDHNVKYYISQQETKSQYLSTDETRKDMLYSLKVNKSLKYSYYGLSLSHSKRDYSRNTLTNNDTTTWSDDSTEIRADYTWKPNRKFNVRSYLKYYDSGYLDLKTSTASIDASWRPTKKYSANFGIMAENIDDDNISTDYLSIYGGGNYRITDHLSANHYFSYYDTESSEFEQNANSFRVGLSYRNRVGKTFSYYLDGNSELKTERGTNFKGNDYFLNKDSKTHNFGAGFSKKLNNINSTFNSNIRYYIYSSSIGERVDRYTLTGTLLTKLYFSLVNSFSANYSRIIGDYKYYGNEKGSYTDTKMLTLIDRVSYNKVLGINGKFNANFGIRYYVSQTQDRANPFADINLNYRLWKNLIFKSSMRVTNDLYTGYTDYTALVGIDYHIRQFSLSTGIRYMDRLDDDNDYARGYGRKNFYLQLKRVF